MDRNATVSLVAQGALTDTSAQEVVAASEHRALQNQVRELQRLLGKKTLEAEILKEALESPLGQKSRYCARCRGPRVVCDERSLRYAPTSLSKRQGRPPRPGEELVEAIKATIGSLPIYGYQRVHALLVRQARGHGQSPPNHKRVYRVMKGNGLLLQRHAGRAEQRRARGRGALQSALVLGRVRDRLRQW